MQSIEEMIDEARNGWNVALAIGDQQRLIDAGNKLSLVLGDLLTLKARNDAPVAVGA